MRREQLVPLVGRQGLKSVTITMRSGCLMDYRILDVGEVYLHGNGPGNGHGPIRLSAILSVSWTEENRHTVRAEAAA